MSEVVDAETPESVSETSADTTAEVTNSTEQEPAAEVDWRARFEAQQKVTRDLEKKVKGEAGTLRTQIEELQAKIEGRDAEFAAEQAKREVERAALAKANERIRKSEVKAAAKGVLADPQDAYKFLDLDSFEVDDDGNVDEAAIQAALNDLVTQKPYLSAQGGSRFQGSADGGARNDAARPAQLSEADLARMTPEQIAQAHDDGRFDELLGNR